ncbi:MAG TPA: CoA-binding protein [Spirillospora sp.]
MHERMCVSAGQAVPRSAGAGRPDTVAGPEPEPPSRLVAVIGASGRDGTTGAELLDTIVSRGFRGAVYAVNPHDAGADVHGVPCVAALADLPRPPDLAVVAVPADAVLAVAAACGRFGASALMVITPGLTAEQGRDLLAVCHEHGMRLVGTPG